MEFILAYEQLQVKIRIARLRHLKGDELTKETFSEDDFANIGRKI